MEQLVHTFLLMLEGTEITLEIFFVTLILSLPIGMLAALGRLSSFKLISRVVEFYIWIMRGTPLMLQLLFVYSPGQAASSGVHHPLLMHRLPTRRS